MTHSELVGYGIGRGMTRIDANRFADDITRKGVNVRNNKEAESHLSAFSVAAGIVLLTTVGVAVAVDDVLLGVPGEIAGLGASVVGEGLGLFADLFF